MPLLRIECMRCAAVNQTKWTGKNTKQNDKTHKYYYVRDFGTNYISKKWLELRCNRNYIWLHPSNVMYDRFRLDIYQHLYFWMAKNIMSLSFHVNQFHLLEMVRANRKQKNWLKFKWRLRTLAISIRSYTNDNYNISDIRVTHGS